MNDTKTVAFLGHSDVPLPGDELIGIVDDLSNSGYNVVFSDELLEHLDNSLVNSNKTSIKSMVDIKTADYAFVFGGDGTFLRVAKHCINYGIPITGINLGVVGFLTDISLKDMRQNIMEICNGDYISEERFVLSASMERNGQITDFNNVNLAVNDIVISRGGSGLLLNLQVYIDKKYIYDLRADGMIISTPSGSTAYAMAAGGPIIEPDLDVISLVPLCAHALNYRPLVANLNDKEIEIHITKSRNPILHFDGRDDISLKNGDVIRIKRHGDLLKIRHPKSYDFYNTLRKKLSWADI